MPVKTYNYDDHTQLSPHFNVQEFKCKCRQNHNILISNELISKLEELYTALNCSKIVINSGYRCPEHDRNVGGDGCGQHTKGTAADIVCYDQNSLPISSKLVSCSAQDLNFRGIANITDEYICTHLDVRENGIYFGDETTGTNTVTNDFYTYYGISKRSDYKIVAKGIDVSYSQGEIDWDKVKESDTVDFVLIRAGYGKEYSQVDEKFERNYKECKRLEIPCGAYWYSYALTKEDALKEADVCLEVIKNKKFEYPIYFDIEDGSQSSLGREKISEISETFCKRVEEAGYWVGIYSYKSFLESNLTEEIRNRYAVWIAHTGIEKTSYLGQYGIWQFSHTGRIDGINGNVDLNYCYSDYPELVKKAGLNGYKKSDTDTKPETNPKKSKNITLIDDGVAYFGILTAE